MTIHQNKKISLLAGEIFLYTRVNQSLDNTYDFPEEYSISMGGNIFCGIRTERGILYCACR